jgi:hypothetical protein
MTDVLLERLTNPMVPYDPEVDAQGFWEDLCAEAKDRIEALTAERDRAIDDARDNAEYVDLVSQFRAERDAAKADNARLTAIVSAMKRYQAGEPSDPPVTGVTKVDIAAITGKETK